MSAHGGRGANQGCRIRVAAKVVVQATHPGGRPYPDFTHMLEQAAKFAQSCRVGGVRKRPLDAIHRPKSFASRQKEHPDSGDEDHPEPRNGCARLPLLRDSHGEANSARDSVPRAQERNNAINAHRRKHNVIRVHECALHARIVLAQVLFASLEPGESGWVVSADEVAKLETQKGKLDHAEALGLV
eukprot:6212451-Pleurochrysis_carterae.AAC.11